MRDSALKNLTASEPDTNIVEFTAYKAGFLYGNGTMHVASRGVSSLAAKLFKNWKLTL